jgi:hypothetical protein
MKRAALVLAAVVIGAALAIAATRPSASTPTSSPTSTPSTVALVPRPAPQISRADVMDQREELSASERGRVHRTRLLDATLVTAAQAHGVSIVAGPARASEDAPQDMVVTPAPDLTVREIADGVSRICGALQDPCKRRDYRFLIQTPSGQALLPARLIEPTTKD